MWIIVGDDYPPFVLRELFPKQNIWILFLSINISLPSKLYSIVRNNHQLIGVLGPFTCMVWRTEKWRINFYKHHGYWKKDLTCSRYPGEWCPRQGPQAPPTNGWSTDRLGLYVLKRAKNIKENIAQVLASSESSEDNSDLSFTYSRHRKSN